MFDAVTVALECRQGTAQQTGRDSGDDCGRRESRPERRQGESAQARFQKSAPRIRQDMVLVNPSLLGRCGPVKVHLT